MNSKMWRNNTQKRARNTASSEIKSGTLKSILKQMRITEKEFEKL